MRNTRIANKALHGTDNGNDANGDPETETHYNISYIAAFLSGEVRAMVLWSEGGGDRSRI